MAIGQKLEDARNRKGISIREASESTKIRGDFLTSFEAGNFDINLPEVYLRGFIRVYARFLGIDPESAVADLNLEIGSSNNKNAKKSIGRIGGTDVSDNKETPSVDSSRNSSIKLKSPNTSLKPVILIAFSVFAVLLFAVVLILIFSSEQNESHVAKQDDESQNTIRETKLDQVVDDKSVLKNVSTLQENASTEAVLKLAAIGPIERLIISDEGKSPKVFHEFKNVEIGWETSIPFSKGFRCYSSSLQNIRFAVNDGIEKQVNGEGAGNFSWSL